MVSRKGIETSHRENRIINLPVDQAYMRLLEFLKSSELKKKFKGTRLIDSEPPSPVKVKMGTLALMKLNIDLTSQNEGSQVQFSFNFSNLRLLCILILAPFLVWNMAFFAFFEIVPILTFIRIFLFLFSAFLVFYVYRNKRMHWVSMFLEAFELFFSPSGSKYSR